MSAQIIQVDNQWTGWFFALGWSSKLSGRQDFFGYWHPSCSPALHTYILQPLLTPTYLRHWTSPGFKAGQFELNLVIPNCHLEAILISWLAHPDGNPNLGQELYSTVLIIQRFSFTFYANLARITQQVILMQGGAVKIIVEQTSHLFLRGLSILPPSHMTKIISLLGNILQYTGWLSWHHWASNRPRSPGSFELWSYHCKNTPACSSTCQAHLPHNDAAWSKPGLFCIHTGEM